MNLNEYPQSTDERKRSRIFENSPDKHHKNVPCRGTWAPRSGRPFSRSGRTSCSSSTSSFVSSSSFFSFSPSQPQFRVRMYLGLSCLHETLRERKNTCSTNDTSARSFVSGRSQKIRDRARTRFEIVYEFSRRQPPRLRKCTPAENLELHGCHRAAPNYTALLFSSSYKNFLTDSNGGVLR